MPRPLLSASVCLLLAAATCRADVSLPAVFGSHMVLQRDAAVPVWGKAAPGEEVTVTFAGQTATAKADDKGRWKTSLAALKANAKPETLTVKGKNTLTLTDVLVGDVWVGSGQSNMEWSLNQVGAKKDIDEAKAPEVRLFHIPKAKSKTANDDVKAAWANVEPKSVRNFSAVLYYFGLKINKEVGVPVGLVNTSWGGSPIEPWFATDKTPAKGGEGEMYNAMVAPIVPTAVKGWLWYQGETSVGQKHGVGYTGKMKTLIEGWRRVWGAELPFYYVQIAPWSRYNSDDFVKVWEGQVGALKIPGTGMAVVTDLVDDINDIHPKNKKDVADRLALWALAKTYGKKDVVYSGPLYKSMKVEGAKIRLSFAHAVGGLASRDGKPLSEFEVAGEDGKFVAAEAVIDGETVVVSAKGVDKPTQARFGWRQIANPNLMNKAKLPASPFKTKDWTGGTGE